MTRFVALLRGINVGGNNVIKMTDLKTAFEKHGFLDVTTFIQSGNVIFSSPKKHEALIKEIEKMLSDRFSYTAKIVLLSKDQLQTVLDNVPADWKKEKDIRCYIAFLKDSVTPDDIARDISINEEVDSLKVGKHALYMTTKLSGLTKSGFNKMIGKKIYQDMTIRNYNTSRKLLELMESVK